jgi:hypothetical protein
MRNKEPIAAAKFRLEGRTLSLIENWRRTQPKIPSRTEAIRRLVERATSELNAEKAGATT